MTGRNLLLTSLAGVVACASLAARQGLTARADSPVLFQGARLIVGDGSNPLERSAFTIEGGRISRVGREGEIPLPAGGTRIDLQGKTVIPALVSAHIHVGLLSGNEFGPEIYTRDKIVEHLQRYAFHGVGAVLSAGTDVGPLSFDIRREQPRDAARLLTAGRGMRHRTADPGSRRLPTHRFRSPPRTKAGSASASSLPCVRTPSRSGWTTGAGASRNSLLISTSRSSRRHTRRD